MGLNTMAISEQEVLRRVGRYEIVRQIGRGATAVVHLARQSDLDRLVALKELAGSYAADPAFVERFLRESRLAASLNHPNVVTVHEYFEHDGAAYIAMEYFERGSLRPLIGMLTLPQVAGVLENLLAGLAHAEAHGVVHRDLKPENVMVASNGSVKIADFGVAKALQSDGSAPLTETGATVGTPAYMAPEQALAAHVGPAADLYAVGIIAYELLTGAVPYRAEVALALLLQHVNDPVPSPRAARPDVDPALSRWVERMLAKEPAGRPVSAAQAWDELDEIVVALLGSRWARQSRLTQGGEPVADAPATAVTRAAQPHGAARPRRLRLAIGTTALLLAAAGGIAAAVALVDRETSTASTPPETTAARTTVEEPPPVPVHATVGGVRFARSGDDQVATLRASGKALGPGAVLVRDAELEDGHAWFELRSARIDSATRGASNGDLELRVRNAPGRLRVDVSADAGAFSTIRVRRVDGRTVAVTAITPEVVDPPPPSNPPTTTEPEETQPPVEEDPPKKPPFKTG
jgi:Protein kinase domain